MTSSPQAISARGRRPLRKMRPILMRKLSLLIGVTLAALALQAGTASAGSTTFTLLGSRNQTTPTSQAWFLKKGDLAASAVFFCVQGNSECAWGFTFRNGSFEIKVHHPEHGSKVQVKADIVNGTRAYAHDRGYVRIYFVTAKRARFTFHLVS